MLKALLVASLVCFSGSALAAHHAPHAKASSSVKLAKRSRHSKKADKAKEKEKAEPADRPGPHSDPRAAAPAAVTPAAEARHGMSRIEFDDRLVQGQTNKANAIYLFERRASALRSLLKKRTNFHEEIDETLE